MTMCVCITTLNEESSIEYLVTYFRVRGHKVFIFDDNSRDNTVEIAIKAGAKVIANKSKVRSGIAQGMLIAWTQALNDDPQCTHILQIDAGRSHSPGDHALMIGAALNLGADIVVGSRFMAGSYYDSLYGSRFRPWLSRLASLMCNIVQSGAWYTDWTSGYRVFSRAAVEYLRKRTYIAKMHGWQIEVLAYAGEAGFKVVEQPIHYHAGRTSFNRKVAAEAFRVWLHIMHNVGWVGSQLYEEQ